MDTFKITSGDYFILGDQIPEFDRDNYTLYGNGENYNMYRNRSLNVINFNMFKTFFDNHLITNTIIKNTTTSATYNLFITDEKLDKNYIISNNQLFNFRPYIYETGECIYNDKNYYYFITDTIITYDFYRFNDIFIMKYMLDILSSFNNIDYVCSDMKYSDFVSCTFGNGHKYDFICLSEFIKKDQYRKTRNIFNSMHTELDNKLTPSDNLITLMLLFMKYNDLYNCNCKQVNFYDQTSIFIINGKYYLRDKAAKMFKINQGFKTPYDLLNFSYIDKFKVLENANISSLFKNSDFMNFIKQHPEYFDSYYLFNENAKKIGLNVDKKIYDAITNLYYPYILFKNTYEDFNNMMKYKYVRNYITREIFDKIKNNLSLFDNWSNFNKIAPQFLKKYIYNGEIFEDIYKTLINYDFEVIDMIINNSNNNKYRNKHNNDSYDTYMFKLIDEYKFLDCINFKNNFIKTIICIFSKIAEINNITSSDIINNFDDYAEQFNNILVSKNLGNEYFSHFAIAIIYAIYTRIEQITPDYQFMNYFIMKLKDLIENDVPNSSKIADEMIKVWCMNGEMISIAKCTTKTQSLFQQFLYGDQNIDNKYRKIDFDKFIDNKYYKFNDDTTFNVYDYEYEED